MNKYSDKICRYLKMLVVFLKRHHLAFIFPSFDPNQTIIIRNKLKSRYWTIKRTNIKNRKSQTKSLKIEK